MNPSYLCWWWRQRKLEGSVFLWILLSRWASTTTATFKEPQNIITANSSVVVNFPIFFHFLSLSLASITLNFACENISFSNKNSVPLSFTPWLSVCRLVCLGLNIKRVVRVGSQERTNTTMGTGVRSYRVYLLLNNRILLFCCVRICYCSNTWFKRGW